MKFTPEQWNLGGSSDRNTVREQDLAKAAADFPPVQAVCETCKGEKKVPNPAYEGKVTLVDHVIPCPTCEGRGFYLREMDSREEHYFLMLLLKTRYQMR